MGSRILFSALVLGLLTVAEARAQTYVQGSFLTIVQPAGVPNHRIRPAISGATVGIAAAAGAFVTPTIAFEGELSVGRNVSTAQRFSYSWIENFTGESRDLSLIGRVRWRPLRHVELTGGGGVAFSRFTRRSVVRTDYFPVAQTSQLGNYATTSRQPTFSGSVGTPLTVGSRIEIVPSFTVQWMDRDADGTAVYYGVGNYAYLIGAGLRFGL